MIVLPFRRIILLGFLLLSTSTFAQTTGLPSLARGTANTASAQVTSDSSNRTLIVPTKHVDLSLVSAIEKLYSSVAIPLSQYGYSTFAAPLSTSLPRGRTPEPYMLGPGDQLTVLLWGDPVDLGELTPQFSTKVDGDGTLFYPPVGQLRADGLLRSEVEKTLASGLAKKYKRFDLRLQVNPQRVFPISVSGLVAQPGTVIVDAWTSLPEILAQAGGVEENGSLRGLRLVKADGREFVIDLYDFLIKAKRPSIKLEEGDGLWVGAIGKTVAVYGEVKVPGIFEVKDGETLADIVEFAGGVLVSAHGAPLTRMVRVVDSWETSTVAWTATDLNRSKVSDGDVYYFRESSGVQSSTERPGYVRINGEVANPGYVEWKPGLTVEQALDRAGGVLSTAYVEGLALTRESVATVQRRQTEQSLASNLAQIKAVEAKMAQATDPIVLAALNQELSARTEAAQLLESTLTSGVLGRIQLDEREGERTPLQPGDSLVVPRQDGIVLLFGEVYNPGAQLWKKGATVRNAIDAVGGVTPNGSWDGVYLIRSNGKVESVTARGNFLGMSSLWGENLRPGDMIFVPTKSADSSQSWALTKDVIALVAQTTTTVTNVLVLLKTLGAL